MLLQRTPALVALAAFAAACRPASVPPTPVSHSMRPAATQAAVLKPSRAPEAAPSPPKLAPPSRWLVLGMFPNPSLGIPSPSGAMRGGVDKDYLEPLGGEAAAVIDRESASRFESNAERVTFAEVESDAAGLVDLNRAFKNCSDRILYAYAELFSDKEQPIVVHFGVDDSAKVWVNGQLVHSQYHPGRGADPWTEQFSVRLSAGKNRVLVKIDNGWLGAAFVFEPFTEATHRVKLAKLAEQRLGEEEMVLGDGKGLVRSEASLPAVKWKNAALAEWALGDPTVAFAWYGPDGKPTNAATQLGLYTAVASYRTKDGVAVRRSLPMLRTAPGFWQSLGWDKPELPKPKRLNYVDWKRIERDVNAWAGSIVMQTPVWDTSLPITLAEVISPQRATNVSLGSHASFIRWQQAQLDLKRRILGLGEAKRVGPTLRASPAPVLRLGSAQQAGMRPQAVGALRKIAADWARADQQPFVLVLARRGVVFLHEAFGQLEGRPLPLDYRFYPASIGKNFAALVFAQFIEQGLLAPTQSVGDVLPSWPRNGTKTVTFRQLFDHTAGLSGHTSYRGLDNPWLEEVFAAHVLPNSDAGVRFLYEGNGNNVAAKAMELIDGRAFPILQREVLFYPLGANSIDQWDCGWAGSATAFDVAKVAQMLLQKGAYGDWQFFGEETWKQLMPTRLAGLYPNLNDTDREWGVGLEPAWDPEDDAASVASSEAEPKKALHTVGHGSASSSIYRIDYQHELVMVAARIGAPNSRVYDEHLHSLVRALEEAVVK